MWATVYVEKDFNETQKHKTIGKNLTKRITYLCSMKNTMEKVSGQMK